MQKFLQKFDELYKGKQYVEIEFYDDNPLTTKYVRYNQSGNVCHCIEGQSTASLKTKNGWQPIECNTEQCQYRQKNEDGKTACNRIAWLKFFIPDVCQDRIWLMKITGQTSINRIDSYIALQKMLGNSLKGRYILFLRQEEQTNKSTGQKFNNYILNIMKKEDFLSEPISPQITENPGEISTKNAQVVNNSIEKQEQSTNKTQATNTEAQDKKPKEKTTKKTTTSKATTTKETKPKETKANTQEPETKSTTDDKANEFENYYILESTFTEKITDKNGVAKDYLIGKFYNMQDQPFNIVVRPEHAAELQECDLGTVVELQTKNVLEKIFAIDLKFIEKRTKKVAA